MPSPAVSWDVFTGCPTRSPIAWTSGSPVAADFLSRLSVLMAKAGSVNASANAAALKVIAAFKNRRRWERSLGASSASTDIVDSLGSDMLLLPLCGNAQHH